MGNHIINMKNLFALILLSISLAASGQISNRLLTGQNYIQQINPDNVVFTIPPNDNRFFVASRTALRFNFNQVVGLLDSVRVYSDTRYKPIAWVPSISQIPSLQLALDGKQPVGSYVTVESDPTVSAYAKSLTSFNVIKAATDPLYATQTAFNALQTQVNSQGFAVNTTTVGLNRTALNTQYPNAGPRFMVFCPDIILGGAIYVKVTTGSTGRWQTISAPPTL